MRKILSLKLISVVNFLFLQTFAFTSADYPPSQSSCWSALFVYEGRSVSMIPSPTADNIFDYNFPAMEFPQKTKISFLGEGARDGGGRVYRVEEHQKEPYIIKIYRNFTEWKEDSKRLKFLKDELRSLNPPPFNVVAELPTGTHKTNITKLSDTRGRTLDDLLNDYSDHDSEIVQQIKQRLLADYEKNLKEFLKHLKAKYPGTYSGADPPLSDQSKAGLFVIPLRNGEEMRLSLTWRNLMINLKTYEMTIIDPH